MVVNVNYCRLFALRKYYCLHCSNKSPRSTGVKLLEQILDNKLSFEIKLFDYGCSTWRNTKYICSKYRVKYAIRCDITSITKPDIVCYPTHLPFRNKVFNVVLLSHILMFLNNKNEWKVVLNELKRICKKYIVIETFHCKGKSRMKSFEKPLQYTKEELLNLINDLKLRIIKKKIDKLMECLVVVLLTRGVLFCEC